MQRFEITAALAYRYRGDVTLSAPPQTAGTPATANLPAAQSVEIYGAITDRRSFKDLRLGLDASRVFGVGSVTYQRTSALSLRASAARELANGHGEWEAEVAYSSTRTTASARTAFNRDWFAMGSLFLNRTAIAHVDAMGSAVDPAVIGLTGFARVAYRF